MSGNARKVGKFCGSKVVFVELKCRVCYWSQQFELNENRS